jgi:hypothetical protein
MKRRIVLLLVCAAALALVVAPAALATSFEITDISPDDGNRGGTISCIVYGSFYHPVSWSTHAPRFWLSDGFTDIAGSTTGVSVFGSGAFVSFHIPAHATLGYYDLFAEQRAGGITYSDFLIDAFWVEQGPVIVGLSPSSATVGSANLGVTVFGDNFIYIPGMGGRTSYVTVNGRPIESAYLSPTRIAVIVPAWALAAPGVLQIAVVNPGAVARGDQISNVVGFPVAAAPAIASISPTWAAPGGPSFTLDVTGSNFLTVWDGAVVRWNTTDLVTTRDSSTHLRATVPASFIATAGTATITVRNGSWGGPVSNGVTFTISLPTPVLTSISPTSAWAGYVRNDFVLTVAGSNFQTGARIALNGVEKANTTVVSPTQLTVPLTAADLAIAGTIAVTVKNPPFPSGSPSATSLPLTVQTETTGPQVSIGGADSLWHNAPVQLSFSATDSQSGVQKVQYTAPPAVTTWTDGSSYVVPTSTQGGIAVSVQATDWCNIASTSTVTVYIDTTKPRTQTLGDATVKKGHMAKLKFRVEEPSGLSPRAAVTIKIVRNDGSTAKKLYFPSARVNADRTAGFECNLKKGTYKWQVYATDLAGNTQANVAKARLTVR